MHLLHFPLSFIIGAPFALLRLPFLFSVSRQSLNFLQKQKKKFHLTYFESNTFISFPIFVQKTLIASVQYFFVSETSENLRYVV